MSNQLNDNEIEKTPFQNGIDRLRSNVSRYRERAITFLGGAVASSLFSIAEINEGNTVEAYYYGGVATLTGMACVYTALKASEASNQVTAIEAAEYQRNGTLPSFMVETVVASEVTSAPAE